MYLRWLGLVLIVLASVVSAVVAFPPGVHRARTRPSHRSGIPQADYVVKQFRSRTVTAVSLPATFLQDDTASLQRTIGSIRPTVPTDAGRIQQIISLFPPGALTDARRTQIQQIINLLPPGEPIDASRIRQVFDLVSPAESTDARRIQLQKVLDLLPPGEPIDPTSIPQIFDLVAPPESTDAIQLQKIAELLAPKPPASEIVPPVTSPSATTTIELNAPVTVEQSTTPLTETEEALATALNGAPLAPQELEQPRTKLFQLRESRLQIDHCSISRFALQITEDGEWILSLRADQNPQGQRELFGIPDGYNPQLHVRQNEFVVTIRCYGAFRTFRKRLDQVVGKPVIGEIGPIKFWVRNGKPNYLHLSNTDAAENDSQNVGTIDLSDEQFDLIDRVEVEFYYQ